jgi:hypothetical protein
MSSKASCIEHCLENFSMENILEIFLEGLKKYKN